MKQLALNLSLFVHRSDVRVVFVLTTIVLYIIGAGAPDASGGVGMGGG
jgi:hypothetical protein